MAAVFEENANYKSNH